jgi:hypothetical protein
MVGVYLAGVFRGTVDFDPGIGTDYKSESVGPKGDYFVTKLGADLSYHWTHVEASNDPYGGNKPLLVDSGDNIYFMGKNPSQYMILIKLNSAGTVVWTKTIVTDGYTVEGQGIEVDSSDNIYVVGTFYCQGDFNPGVGVDTVVFAGESDIFLLKVKNDGSHGWVRTFGGDSYDFGNVIEINQADNLYIGGNFRGTVDFDPSDVDVDNRTSVAHDAIRSIETDSIGDIYIGGSFVHRRHK